MKQTAVEWLALYIKGITSLNCDEVIEKANEIFEQQIKDAWDDGHFEITGCIDAEQYYNKTFKSE